MRSPKVKFAVAIAVLVGALAWLAVIGMQESKTYYITVAELKRMGADVRQKRLRVGGRVVAGSIQREGRRVRFLLEQDAETLPVVYVGRDPVPDTFVDHAEALVEGRWGEDGVFHAQKLQAKCASKYEPAEGSGSSTSSGT
jgi:cytochrome c-type biogenesis protein CcmE